MEDGIYLCIFFVVFSGVTSQSVTITEDTVYIINNAVGQVSCTLTGSCSAINWYFSSISVPVSTSFIGFSCQNTTNGFYQTCDYSNHQYTLYFTGTTNLHGQTIRCSGGSCSPQQTVSDTATISVIAPVPSVALEGISGQQITVTAGQSKYITCVTGSSRPAPRILWYIGMTNVTSLSIETQIPSQELFYTRSTLTFIPTKSQNGLQVNCKAYNTDNNMMELTTKTTLNVQYPPDDSNAVMKQGNTISTIEGKSTTLVCEVRGGNPLSSITWDCFGLTGTSSTDGDVSRSTINFIAQRSYNRRTCTCKASHPTVNLGSDSVTINVYYGPAGISFQPGITLYTRNEGENLGPIQCVADCNPKCNFVWTRPVQSDYNGENLTISGITRTQEGHYKCTASNSYGSKSGFKISVVVNYGPDTVILTPSTNTYIVNETFQLGPIKCFATCKPHCSYRWIRPNQNDIVGDSLTINNIQRTQRGTYRCKAYNTVGTLNSNNVSVIVHYAAKVTNINISDGNNFTIPEHSTKSVTCLAEGLPQPTITLTYISNSSVIKSVNGLRLDFTFPLARCEDTGIYKCNAINKFTPQQPLQKDVFVMCKPRAASRPLKNHFVLNSSNIINITVPYIAYPRPIFQWFKNISDGSSTQITDYQDDVQINTTAINTYTYVTQLVRRNLKEDDFGTYVLRSSNVIGTNEDIYTIKVKGKPDQPIGGLAICIDYNSAVITWVSGFDNGDKQTFTVVFQEKGETEQSSFSNIKDPGLHKPISRTVVSLKESKLYVFRIFSRNVFGESSRLTVNCSTKAQYNTKTNTGEAVGAGIGSALVLVIILIIVIYSFRRYQAKAKGTNNKTDSQRDGRNQTENGGDSNETHMSNILNGKDTYGNASNTGTQKQNYETMQTLNDEQPYEQIKMEDISETSDADAIYVNTTIR